MVNIDLQEARKGLNIIGVRGALRSALFSYEHSLPWGSFICHPNVIVDVASDSQIKLDGQLLMGTAQNGATHPAIAKSKLEVQSEGTLTQTGGSARIGPGSVVHVEGDFVIGDSYINSHSRILCEEKIKIGDGCSLAWNIELLDSDRHQLSVNGSNKMKTSPININDDVWVGHDVSIKKGVTIGSGAVIGSNSVVTSDVPEHTLVVGCPAQTIYEDVQWKD